VASVLLNSGGEAALIWHRLAEQPIHLRKSSAGGISRRLRSHWEKSQNFARDIMNLADEIKISRDLRERERFYEATLISRGLHHRVRLPVAHSECSR
jgi:hypothetical protein